MVPTSEGRLGTSGTTSGSPRSRPRRGGSGPLPALSLLGLQAHRGGGPERRRPGLFRPSDVPHHAGAEPAAEAGSPPCRAAPDEAPVRAASLAPQRSVADGRDLPPPAPGALVVRGDGDRLLLPVPAGVPSDAVPERGLGGGRPGSRPGRGGALPRSAGSRADAGHRQRLVLSGPQVPEAHRGAVLPCADPVSNPATAGTAGAVPFDVEEGGGVLAHVRRTQPCPAVSRGVPRSLQPGAAALGAPALREGGSTDARRRLRGRPGGRHTEVAEMGEGGEEKTGGGSYGTEGRVAMNHEISLHRKIPANFDSKTSAYGDSNGEHQWSVDPCEHFLSELTVR